MRYSLAGDGCDSDPSLTASLLPNLGRLRITLEDDRADDGDSLSVQEVPGVIRQCSALMSLTIASGDASKVCDVLQEACTSRSIMIALNSMYRPRGLDRTAARFYCTYMI
jgi:hypothetical protein